MKLSQWRPGLKSWLSSKVDIESYDLRQPTEYGKFICFIPPLNAVSLGDTSTRIGTAIQQVYLTIRYRGDIRYVDLPLASIEGMLLSLQLLAIRDYTSIAPVTTVNVLSVAEPIKVSEYGDGLADWLVVTQLDLEIVFVAEPEDTLAPSVSSTNVRVEAGLFTEHLTPVPPNLLPPESHKDVTNRDRYTTLI